MSDSDDLNPKSRDERGVNIDVKIDVPADVSRETLNFVQRILGPVAEATDFLSEKIRFYRWQTAVKTLVRARDIAKEQGFEPNEVPIKFLVPFLEGCSLETDDDSLIEKWAQLLATAVNKFEDQFISFGNILKELSPEESRLLSEIRKETKRPMKSHYYNLARVYGNAYNLDGLEIDLFDDAEGMFIQDGYARTFTENEDAWEMPIIISLINLERLRLIKIHSKIYETHTGERCSKTVIVLTPLGAKFLSVCEADS